MTTAPPLPLHWLDTSRRRTIHTYRQGKAITHCGYNVDRFMVSTHRLLGYRLCIVCFPRETLTRYTREPVYGVKGSLIDPGIRAPEVGS